MRTLRFVVLALLATLALPAAASPAPASTSFAVVGTFTFHGGMITTLDRGPNCTNQRYRVVDTLQNVSTTTTTSGTGTFTVTLTHYRHRILGRCIAYKARVAGTLTFSF